jgi:hypothetical protein
VPDQTIDIVRFVHYVSLGSANGEFPSACRVAIVTETDPEIIGHVGLCVINPTGFHFRPLATGGVHADPDGAPDTWHWPQQCPHRT